MEVITMRGNTIPCCLSFAFWKGCKKMIKIENLVLNENIYFIPNGDGRYLQCSVLKVLPDNRTAIVKTNLEDLRVRYRQIPINFVYEIRDEYGNIDYQIYLLKQYRKFIKSVERLKVYVNAKN